MLEEKDLLAIGQLMEQKLDPVHQRLDRIEDKIETVENRLATVETKVDSLEMKVDSLENRLDHVEERLGVLEQDVKELKQDTKQMEKRMAKQMDARFFYLNESIRKVSRRLKYNTELLIRTDREILRDVAALR